MTDRMKHCLKDLILFGPSIAKPPKIRPQACSAKVQIWIRDFSANNFKENNYIFADLLMFKSPQIVNPQSDTFAEGPLILI
jgi:hypothetical protein